MNYGLFYKQVTFNRDSIATVQKAIATATLEWEEGRLYNQKVIQKE